MCLLDTWIPLSGDLGYYVSCLPTFYMTHFALNETFFAAVMVFVWVILYCLNFTGIFCWFSRCAYVALFRVNSITIYCFWSSTHHQFFTCSFSKAIIVLYKFPCFICLVFFDKIQMHGGFVFLTFPLGSIWLLHLNS